MCCVQCLCESVRVSECVCVCVCVCVRERERERCLVCVSVCESPVSISTFQRHQFTFLLT